MQNLGSSAVKNTYLHTKQLEKKYLHHVKRKQFLPHTKQLEKDQTDRRNIYVFWGQDMVRTNLGDMDLWGPF